MNTDFIFMNEVLLDKDSHGTNLTNNQIETCQFHNQVLRSFLAKYRDFLSLRRLVGLVGLALAAKTYQMGNLYYERGEIKVAFGHYWTGLKCSLTLQNFMRFLWIVTKKSTRTISGGIISRKNWVIFLRKLKG